MIKYRALKYNNYIYLFYKSTVNDSEKLGLKLSTVIEISKYNHHIFPDNTSLILLMTNNPKYIDCFYDFSISKFNYIAKKLNLEIEYLGIEII